MTIEPAADANPFAHFSSVALADAMGDIDVVLKGAKERQDLAREEMNRRRLSSLEGARFTITKDVKSEKRVDSAAVKAHLGAAVYASFQKPNSRTTYTVTPRPPEQLGDTA